MPSLRSLSLVCLTAVVAHAQVDAGLDVPDAGLRGKTVGEQTFRGWVLPDGSHFADVTEGWSFELAPHEPVLFAKRAPTNSDPRFGDQVFQLNGGPASCGREQLTGMPASPVLVGKVPFDKWLTRSFVSGADPALDDVTGHVAKPVTVGFFRFPEGAQVHLVGGVVESAHDTTGSAALSLGRFKTNQLDAVHGKAPFLVECRRAIHPQFPDHQLRVACAKALEEGHWPGVTTFEVRVPRKGVTPTPESCPTDEGPVTGYLVQLAYCPACRGYDAPDFAPTVLLTPEGKAPDAATAKAIEASLQLRCRPCGRVP
jgi:hypothetical protein